MGRKDEAVLEEVHEAFNTDTSHKLARATVEAVLDLHHEWQGRCYACSVYSPLMGVSYPCKTVAKVLSTVRGG